MFQFIRELGNSLTSNTDTSNKAVKGTEKKENMVKKNKTFKLKRKNVMEELENLTTKYPYMRPVFLGLRTQEELHMALRHSERTITLPKRSTLPRAAGYAECVNAGKSLFNEDQASAIELNMGLMVNNSNESNDEFLKHLDRMTVFGVFDGHAGADVAVTVSHELPHRIKARLWDVMEEIKQAHYDNIQENLSPLTINSPIAPGPARRKPTVDRLITGALEAAFHDMDSNLVEDAANYTVKGGCAAIVTLFYANKIYIANAGDCRAVLSVGREPVMVSNDFTPESERRRLQALAEQHPDLLADEFCSLQFTQRLTRKDIGTQMLYRDSRMEGWAHKEIVEKDLRFPLIMGDGRRSRLLATIGLTRGLGDHSLKVFDSAIHIKPFLSCTPEVMVYNFDAQQSTLTPNDVIIMGSDGLWDVTTNHEAIDIVNKVLTGLPINDSSRYIAAAQALVSHARGKLKVDRRDVWLLNNSMEYSSHDDITCFVVPVSESAVYLDSSTESCTPYGVTSSSSDKEDPVDTHKTNISVTDINTENSPLESKGDESIEDQLNNETESLPIKTPGCSVLPEDIAQTLDSNSDMPVESEPPAHSEDNVDDECHTPSARCDQAEEQVLAGVVDLVEPGSTAENMENEVDKGTVGDTDLAVTGEHGKDVVEQGVEPKTKDLDLGSTADVDINISSNMTSATTDLHDDEDDTLTETSRMEP